MQNCACGPLLSLNARDKVSSDASKLGLELSYLKLLAKVAVSENPFSPFELQEGRCSKDGGGGYSDSHVTAILANNSYRAREALA